MCGRFNDHLPDSHGWIEFLKDWPADHVRSYNRAPTTQIAAFRDSSGEQMRWGMIAPWSKEFASSYATFNARVETVSEKATFRNAWKKQQHCLIPMAGYYEWKGPKGAKQPYYITDNENGAIVTAGLWEEWHDGQLSCTIITLPSDDELAELHHRIPAMLTVEAANDWLNGDQSALEKGRPDVVYYPVGKAVGNTRNDVPELIEKIEI